MKLFITLSIALFISAPHSYSQKIVTWNVKDIFTITDVNSRKSDFEKFGREVKPDILILQEVTSTGEVEQIAKHMGLTKYHIAISNFNNDSDKRGSFEVAILSKYQLSNVIEYETMTDNRTINGGIERKIEDPKIDGFEYKRGARGFLSAYIRELDLWVTGVHLKSSLGNSGIQRDGSNAQKRETVMMGYKQFVKSYSERYQNTSFLIAGDFNVGHSDEGKNGSDITNDSTDGYDDTHYILTSDLFCSCSFKNLAKSITTTTYPDFNGSPIDNIYVYGKIKYTDAKKESKTYGSDHLPVICEIKN